MKSKDYLDYMSNYPCYLSGSHHLVELHHESVVRRFWAGQKKNFDFGVIPLSKELHYQRHSWGRRRFWEHHGEDPALICLAYLTLFLSEVDPENEDALEAMTLLEAATKHSQYAIE